MESNLLKRKIERGEEIVVAYRQEVDKDKACMAARELEALWREFLGKDGEKFFDIEAFYSLPIPDPDQRNDAMAKIIIKYFGACPHTGVPELVKEIDSFLAEGPNNNNSEVT